MLTQTVLDRLHVMNEMPFPGVLTECIVRRCMLLTQLGNTRDTLHHAINNKIAVIQALLLQESRHGDWDQDDRDHLTRYRTELAEMRAGKARLEDRMRDEAARAHMLLNYLPCSLIPVDLQFF